MTSNKTLSITRRFNAAPVRVFDAWLNPALAGRWLFTSATSESHDTRIDARVGGKWTVADRRDGKDYTALGEYLEIERPRRLVFSFAMPQFSDQSARISIDIKPDGDGCLLTFTHENVAPDEHVGVTSGWNDMLDGLEVAVDTNGSCGRVIAPATLRFERLLPGPIERVWDYLVDAEKRGQWLAAGPLEPRVGGKVNLFFHYASLSPEKVPTPEAYRKIEDGVHGTELVTRYEPPHALGITWGHDPAGDPNALSEVLFELKQEGDKVRLVLTHSRVAKRAEMLNYAGGWHTHLAILVERAHGRVPPAFWTVFGQLGETYAARMPAETAAAGAATRE